MKESLRIGTSTGAFRHPRAPLLPCSREPLPGHSTIAAASRCALGLVLLLAAGCGGLGEREASLFEQAKQAMEAGDWAGADRGTSAVLEVSPEFAPAHLLRGRARFELKRYEEALGEIEQARASGDLEPEEVFTALLYRGRCSLELGRVTVPDVEFRSTDGKPEDRRRARDHFLQANVTLLEAAALRPDDYSVNLWRGVSLLRLENYRKALDTFEVCERISQGRWEHKFYSALAWEGLYRVNTQSLETYFAIIAGQPRQEQEPVLEHLVTIAPETTPDIQKKVFDQVERFTRAIPAVSPRIGTYLAAERTRRQAEERAARIREMASKVNALVEKGRFPEAVTLIESQLKLDGEQPEVQRLLRETQESWASLLEARSEELAGQGDRGSLEQAVKNLELARTLTSKVDRIVSIQQKLTTVQAGLSRHESSRKIQKAQELHKSGRHQEVLDLLGALATDGLSERDRDSYNFLRGAASYQLGQWTAAVKSFSLLSQRNFEGVDVLHGLALVRSGQETAGVALLSNLPPEARNDEVNRILGSNLLEKGDLPRATAYLSSIKTPTPADIEAHLRARRELGIELYRKGELPRAVEELQAARQIIETQLRRRDVEIYLYLGNAYFRLDDFDRARKAYQDLTATDLTSTERERCKELFLNRGQIHLREKNTEQAYADFAELVRLGGQIPPELSNAYQRLLATYADFLPLGKIQYWNYVSTAKDYNYTLYVKEESSGEFRVERRETGSNSIEVWSRQGVVLTKRVGDTMVKLPINVKPGEESLPFIEYTSQGQACTSEIVALGQTVETQAGKRFADCLKVRVYRSQKMADGTIRATKHIYYFAPGVGEVKQEIYRDERKVSEIVLSDFAQKTISLGN